jgi:hypothetical protein
MATKLYVVYVSSTQLSVHTLFARPIAELFFGLSVCRPMFLSLAVSRISRHFNS